MNVPLDLSAMSVESAHAVYEFDQFYRGHAEVIGRALELTLGDPELASDALNEAMSKTLVRWEQVQRFANPAGWVYRVGLNWARSWLRGRRRERDRPMPLGPSTGGEPIVEAGLSRALDRLPVEQRAVVVCRYFLDWSTAETAASLKVPAGTVKSRLSRALNQIRSDLGVAGADEEQADDV